MEKKFEKKYLAQASSHWWTKARRDILLRMLHRYPQNTRILDIGCGGGELLRDLRDLGFFNVTGVDISEESISFCKKQNSNSAYVMDANNLSFSDNSFDVIIASDILEHIKDDEPALREWKRVLAIKGVIILFVPAFMFLWSSHDEINHHYRRYTKNILKEKFIRNNFLVKKIGYWNFLLFAPIFLIRLLGFIFEFLFRKKDKDDKISELGTDFLNSWLSLIVKIENILIQKGFLLPIGSSIYIVAKKK